MRIMRLKSAHVVVLLFFIVMVIIVLSFIYAQGRDIGSNDMQKVDWTQKGRDIAQRDPALRAITGNQQKLISGIIWEGSNADLYYQIEGRIYNVSVDFKNETITSIKEENDEKKLEWLRNISTSVTSENITVVSAGTIGPG